jgi:GAF domain-containing protein
MKRAYQNENSLNGNDPSEFMSSSDKGSYLNSNSYVKLMNNDMSPDAIAKQMASASPEGIKFLTSFLSKQCTRFQQILQSLDEISKQPDLEVSAEKLFDLMLIATDAKYATIYYSSAPGTAVKVYNSNWPYSRNTVNEEQIFASDALFKGELINVYNFGASDHYKSTQSLHYNSVDPNCVLSAPFFGDGLRVTGILELIGKKTGNPLFSVEEEFILQSIASVATILFGQLSVKEASDKKNDSLKAFMETTNSLPVAKVEVGDLIEVVMNSARELVNADRCTLFLFNEETDELWSKLAHGSDQIHIPSNAGMAGHVFQTGRAINTEDGNNFFGSCIFTFI